MKQQQEQAEAQGAETKKKRTYSLTIEEIQMLANSPEKLKKFKETGEMWPVLTTSQLLKSL